MDGGDGGDSCTTGLSSRMVRTGGGEFGLPPRTEEMDENIESTRDEAPSCVLDSGGNEISSLLLLLLVSSSDACFFLL